MEEGSRRREGVEKGGLSLHLRSSLLAGSLLPAKGDPGRSGHSKSHPLPSSLSPSLPPSPPPPTAPPQLPLAPHPLRTPSTRLRMKKEPSRMRVTK